jgi:Domain of unknown function (DUF4386)
MTIAPQAASNRSMARTAGVLYLIVVLAGIFSLAYVPSQIVVDGDAAAKVASIAAHASLYRLGIVAGFVCYTAFLLLPFALYRLLGKVHQVAAVLMVAFAVVSVPLAFVNLMHKLDVLSLLGGADHLSAFPGEQLNAMVMLSLEAYRNGMLVTEIFWGLWLLPFGYLVYKSGFLPKILGILLMLGCLGYLTEVLGTMLMPGYAKSTLASVVSLPASVAEISICLWLSIVGARETPRIPD